LNFEEGEPRENTWRDGRERDRAHLERGIVYKT